MTDTKLDPATLSAEERAFVDLLAAQRRRDGFPDDKCHEYAFEDARCMILARRALFAPATEKVETTADRIAADLKAGTFRGVQPEPAATEKVVCPNCLRETETTFQHEIRLPAGYSPEYACQPEPAAPEMPEAVRVNTFRLEELLKYADLAEVALRTGFHPPEFLFTPADRSLRQCIDAIKEERDKWRTHSQPVAVGMTEELEHVLRLANELQKILMSEGDAGEARRAMSSIAAVRDAAQIGASFGGRMSEESSQQAAQVPKLELPKVREILEVLQFKSVKQPDISVGHYRKALQDALAELDAAEGRK